MLPVSQAVIQALEDARWEYEGHPGQAGASFSVEGDTGSWTCLAYADDYKGYVAFYSVAPLEVFTNRREALAEYLARVNCTVVVGNFEQEWDDGVVRFKTSFDFTALDSDTLDPEVALQIMAWLLNANLSVFELYLPGIRAVIEDGMHPEVAARRYG